MSTKKYKTKRRRVRRKQTKKMRSIRSNKHMSKKMYRNKPMHRKIPLSYIATLNGGGTINPELLNKMIEFIKLFKETYGNDKATNLTEEDKLYVDIFKKNENAFKQFEAMMSSKVKYKNDEYTEYEEKAIKKLVKKILKIPYNFGIAEGLQSLLNSIYLYFVNDIEIKDNMKFLFKKRLTSENHPYVNIIHNRTGYESVYDVNEMLALIKSESINEKPTEAYTEGIINQLDINNHFTIAPRNTIKKATPGSPPGPPPGSTPGSTPVKTLSVVQVPSA